MRIQAPLSGVIVPLDQVPDAVFAQKMAGDGVSIDPTDSILRAPFAGKIEFLHPSHHALTLLSPEGAEVLIHIGIDTVQLRGDGFKARVAQGAQVRAGDPLIEFDLDQVACKSKSLLTQVLVVNYPKFKFKWNPQAFAVAGKTELFSIEAKGESKKGSRVDAPQTANTASASVQTSPTLTCMNPTGLHARPAATLAAEAQKFKSEISLHKGDKSANAKSLTAIISLEVANQSRVYFTARGVDAKVAVEHLYTQLQAGLGEGFGNAGPTKPSLTATPKREQAQAQNPDELSGISASPGLVIGSIYLLDSQELQPADVPGKGVAYETQRLQIAQDQARGRIQELASAKNVSAESKGIFQAHLQLLADPDLTARAMVQIKNGTAAPKAWHSAYHETADLLRSLDNELLAERSQDVKDVGQRVLRLLMGVEESRQAIPAQSIVVARQVTPSQFSFLLEQKIVGLATVEGGPSSHVGILARSMSIPMLTGLPEVVLETPSLKKAILDADEALFFLKPSPELLSKTEKRQSALKEQQAVNLKHAQEKAVTLDGFRMDVFANIGNVAEAQQSVAMGAEGVGLLRSEFLFLKRQTPPTEKEQGQIYSDIVAALKGQPVIIRTLDVGGDKPLSYLPVPPEENPFLGVRGLRLSLAQPEIFRTQLRAILSVKAIEQVRIMFPMVTSLFELIEAKKILEEERNVIGAKPVQIGIMVEVPSAALLAEVFAPHVDFFSIGSNDLTQYALAIDRGHRDLAKQADGLHPAVLQLIGMTAKAGAKYKKHVGVCGGIASDPQAVPLLVGLGVTELSVSVPSIAEIKASVRKLNKKKCQELAERALMMDSAEQVRAASKEFLI